LRGTVDQIFLGADLGGTKTHVVVADGTGRVLGFAESGPGNHESVGYDGFKQSLHQGVSAALSAAGATPMAVTGAGFGIAGYDWPIETEPMLNVIRTLGLSGETGLVNDVELGLLAGSPHGWGVAVVSGTGCNCRGWDETRQHHGRVTGGGIEFGEFAGASELMYRAARAIAYHWTGRGPATALSDTFVKRFNVADLGDLLQNLICHNIEFSASDAPLVFQVAATGDAVALDLIRWAGSELGQMACTVIRQLHFESLDFDLVQIGSMFDGSPLLSEDMKKVVYALAPRANFIRTKHPPVTGAVLLGMQSAGIEITEETRQTLFATMPNLKNHNGGS
jgi:N-acetylglucosamine kinase-like BadF-type ATPase